MKENLSFGEILWPLAQEKGFTQTKIAEIIGRPATQVNKYFCGRGDVTGKNQILILNAIGFDLEKEIHHLRRNLKPEKNIKCINDLVVCLFQHLDHESKKAILTLLLGSIEIGGIKQLPEEIKQIANYELNSKIIGGQEIDGSY